MTDGRAELLEAVADDAARLASLLRDRRGDRGWRQRARAALARAFAVVEAGRGHESDASSPPESPPPDLEAAQPSPAGSVASAAGVLRELETVRQGLGDPLLPPVRRLADVRVQRPLPERRQIGRAAARVEALVGRIVARATLPTALDEARVAWFEARCETAAPGLLRPMGRAASGPSGERLSAGELELIRKRRGPPMS